MERIVQWEWGVHGTLGVSQPWLPPQRKWWRLKYRSRANGSWYLLCFCAVTGQCVWQVYNHVWVQCHCLWWGLVDLVDLVQTLECTDPWMYRPLNVQTPECTDPWMESALTVLSVIERESCRVPMQGISVVSHDMGSGLGSSFRSQNKKYWVRDRNHYMGRPWQGEGKNSIKGIGKRVHEREREWNPQ